MDVFDMQRPVVAVSSDGSYLVTRAGAELTVWSGAGVKVRTIESRVSEAKPGLWYAVSRVGDIAEAFEGTLRLIDRTGAVRWKQSTAGGPSAAIVGAATALGGSMWGAPRFTPDGARLATLHQGGVAFWDPRTGKRLGSVANSRLTLVRDIAFSNDGRVAVARCNSNLAGPANHTAFVLKLDSIAEPVELPWHKGAVLAVSFASARTVATLDESGTISLWGANGFLEARLRFPFRVTSFSTLGPLDRLVVAGDAGKLWSWEKAGGRMATVREQGEPVSFLRLTPDARVEIVESAGPTRVLDFPGKQGGTTLELRRYDEDPEMMQARAALWLLQREDYAEAIRQLQPFQVGVDLRLTIAFLYATLRLDDDNADFGGYLRERGLALGDPATASALLMLAEDFGDASAISLSLDFLMAWFRARKVHADLGRDDDRAVAVGLKLAADMASNDDDETAAKLLLYMMKQWAGRWDLTEATSKALALSDEKQATDIMNRYISAHPSELRAWQALAGIHWARESAKTVVAEMLGRAQTYLNLAQADSHEFLGGAYSQIEERELALHHYEIAVRLAPDNRAYAEKLTQLGGGPPPPEA